MIMMTGCVTTDECAWAKKISMCDKDIELSSRHLKNQIRGHTQSGMKYCGWKTGDKEPLECGAD